jgi:hypothetical protein
LKILSIAILAFCAFGQDTPRIDESTDGCNAAHRNTLSEVVNAKRGMSPEMAVRLSKVFGGTEEGWFVQQAQYDLAQVRRDRMRLKKLELV